MLVRTDNEGVSFHTDPILRERAGILLAFSERTGGVSPPPFESLDLAGHVGDDPAAVDENRGRFLSAVGAGSFSAMLTTAEQVHGDVVVRVERSHAGSGASVQCAPGPISGADALWTAEAGIPLMLFFADCVPVILVSESPRAVAVVHAGWKGTYAGIVGAAARAMIAGVGPVELSAYVGPHIGACCYEVSPSLVSHFVNRFVTIPRASDRLDLAAAVAEDLDRAGIPRERQWHLGNCTAHNTNRYFSYRAEGRTGRHCAFAMLEPR
jgi:YfiH family protein